MMLFISIVATPSNPPVRYQSFEIGKSVSWGRSFGLNKNNIMVETQRPIKKLYQVLAKTLVFSDSLELMVRDVTILSPATRESMTGTIENSECISITIIPPNINIIPVNSYL